MKLSERIQGVVAGLVLTVVSWGVIVVYADPDQVWQQLPAITHFGALGLLGLAFAVAALLPHKWLKEARARGGYYASRPIGIAGLFS